MQSAFLSLGPVNLALTFPDPEVDVVPGVPWGRVEGFPTPAGWAYLTLAYRLSEAPPHARLGATLREEVGACLLGGHGLPAAVGLAAFAHLRDQGAFAGPTPSQAQLEAWLRAPLWIRGKAVHYRFAAQKARHLHGTLAYLDQHNLPQHSGQALRNALLPCPGVGPKTASWIARNWLGADDVAILDIHVLRAGVIGRFFPPSARVERDYLALEAQFLAFAQGLGVRASDLDAVIWRTMAQSPRTVQDLIARLPPELAQAACLPGASGARTTARSR